VNGNWKRKGKDEIRDTEKERKDRFRPSNYLHHLIYRTVGRARKRKRKGVLTTSLLPDKKEGGGGGGEGWVDVLFLLPLHQKKERKKKREKIGV